jgi:hypothetical protein
MDNMEGTDAATQRIGVSRAQSAVDFLVTYGWALLLLALVLVVLYAYVSLPPNIAPGTCNFYSGMSCTDMVLSSNGLIMFLVNSQSFPISTPTLYASINNRNTITASCVPNFVLPGGVMSCTINALPVSTPLGTLSNGYVYLSAAYCGLATNYATTGNCITAPTLTYSGSFTAHTEPQQNPIPYASNYIIYVSAKYATLSHGTTLDPFYTQVMLGNSPVAGETVSFTINNNAFYLQPITTLTNMTGNALGYVWGGGGAGRVTVTATLGSTSGTPSNTVTITFT